MRSKLIGTILLFSQSYLSITIIIFLTQFDWKQFGTYKTDSLSPKSNITCLILEFENFENDLIPTVQSICSVFSKVIIYSDNFIYPPIDLSSIIVDNCQIEIFESTKSIKNGNVLLNLYRSIANDRYLLILPDRSRIKHEKNFGINLFESLITKIEQEKIDALIIPFIEDDSVRCDHFRFDYKRWTLEFFDYSNLISGTKTSCLYRSDLDLIVLVSIANVLKLAQPLLRPFVQSFLLQSSISDSRIVFHQTESFKRRSLYFRDSRNQVKYQWLLEERVKNMYRKLGIKKILKPNKTVEWFGCDRKTSRCFSTIINDLPEYLVNDRWLPPCCRKNLELTGRYVFSLLEKFQIRYWIEGGSLLGAARNHQIIDWDYDIDIGIYQDDMYKMSIMKRLFQERHGYRIKDGQGFVWEKALEGDFIKIHYSMENRIHVDIFPFVSVNGTMTKDSWFDNHPQDRPFPEHFLKPLERIEFIGMNVSVPNNVRQFLELKFGPGCIEQPKYPNAK
ncbi:TOM1-like protein 2 [Sarcoptes scabiei]|nr:TOM1-like protein 2 [Sarcoptes scabiei]